SVAIKGNPLPLNQERLVHILKQVCEKCSCGERDHETISINPIGQEPAAESSFTIINSYASENSVVEKGNSWTI
ncbi:alcohol dehydrogenase, partial [Vibrio sp. 10N.261.45.A7]